MNAARGLAVGSFPLSGWRTCIALLAGRRILIGRRFWVRGLRNIVVRGGHLRVGVSYFGFADYRLGGLLRIQGRLSVGKNVRIASGGRWDVAQGAEAVVGNGTYFGPGTKVIIRHGLKVGAGCAISWDCQFLDDDYHTLVGSTTGSSGGAIHVGDHVWIGSRVTILKGAEVPNGCVVASGSVVTGKFAEPYCVIGGIPARVLRRDIEWK